MAKYLLTLRSSGSLAAVRDVPPPAECLVECEDGRVADAGSDGLERWEVELQVAGVLLEWASGGAFDSFWDFVAKALATTEVRPRGELRVKSRADPRRVGVTFAYMGDHEVARAREALKTRIVAAFDPKTKRLRNDVELKV
jgi:hypothetical protein